MLDLAWRQLIVKIANIFCYAKKLYKTFFNSCRCEKMQSFDLSIQVNLFELSNYISQLTQQNEVSASSFFLFLKLLMIKAKFLRKCYCFHHSHKKRKDSLESRTVFLIFSLELKISGVAVQSVHQNSYKWRLLGGIAWWK